MDEMWRTCNCGKCDDEGMGHMSRENIKSEFKKSLDELYLRLDEMRKANEMLMANNKKLKHTTDAIEIEKTKMRVQLDHLTKRNEQLQASYNDLNANTHIIRYKARL